MSDYVPLHSHSGKLKKESLGESFTLELKRNLDILSTIPKKGYKVIGFKAELDEKNGLINAQKMLEAKELDAVCLNILKEQNNFGSNKNEITFITKTHVETLALSDKFNIAQSIAKQSQHL